MPRMRTRSVVFGVELGFLLCSVLLATSSAQAGMLDATWTAPTTNTDGSLLTDLASYRVYYSTSGSPCPGSSSSVSVASPTPQPGVSGPRTMSVRLSGLAIGTSYNVSVAAVDSSGNQGPCSSIASASARADFTVSPTGTVNFGSVSVGGIAERTLTVSNTGGGSLSGTASVAPPFTIVSGSPFALDATKTTQSVTVRFTPTSATTVSTNIHFTAGGGTISRALTGAGGALSDSTPPTVAVTAPTAAATVTGTVTVSGNATDAGGSGVAGVQFKLDGANLGPEVTAAPYSMTWNTTAVANGSHVLTAVARDAAGNVRTSPGVTVTVANTGGGGATIWPSTATPAVASVNDSNAVEVGVKFRADVNGFITGLRFYKGAQNTGTHVGKLWTASGTLLASVTFTGESASGWQQSNLVSPVAITANTVYVASYHTDVGHYAATSGYFNGAGVDNPPLHALGTTVSPNGVYRYGASAFPNQTFNGSNYWVDVVFATNQGPDTTRPTVTASTPASGATGVAPSSNVTVTFSEAMNAATINSTTFELRNAANTVVPAAVTYAGATRTATLDPTGSLATSTTYTVTVRGGSSDPRVKDVAGNALASNFTRSFTTAAASPPPPSACPCTIWPSTVTPAVASHSDPNAVEVGVKFRADVNGFITGLRFYKGAQNTGTHVGKLWTASGTLLASVTFTGESASGWQQSNLVSPVAITANTVYVASYHTDVGHYAATSGYFNGAGVDNPPLHALGTTVSPNGVYRYGASAFPNQTFNGSNYWVDVVFTTSP